MITAIAILYSSQYNKIDPNWDKWTPEQLTAVNWYYSTARNSYPWDDASKPHNQLAADLLAAWINSVFGSQERGAEIQEKITTLIQNEHPKSL